MYSALPHASFTNLKKLNFSDVTVHPSLCLSLTNTSSTFKDTPISEALTCMKIYLYKQLWQFYQEDWYFCLHCCLSNSCIFKPNYAVLYYSTACFSVIFESLPGFIPFASLRHAGWILGKNFNLNMNNSFLTTIERDNIIHTVVTSHRAGKVTYREFLSNNCRYFLSTRNTYIWEITLIHCRRITVVHVRVNIFL